MFDLIRESKAGGVIQISGDRHSAEIYKLPQTRMGYPLYEVTSSALNNSIRSWFNEVNPNRVGVPYIQDNFGLIEIDWSLTDPAIDLQILDVKCKSVLLHQTMLSELQPEG